VVTQSTVGGKVILSKDFIEDKAAPKPPGKDIWDR